MYRTEELKDNLIAVSFTKRPQPFTLNKNAFRNFVNCLEKYAVGNRFYRILSSNCGLAINSEI